MKSNFWQRHPQLVDIISVIIFVISVIIGLVSFVLAVFGMEEKYRVLAKIAIVLFIITMLIFMFGTIGWLCLLSK